MKPHLPTAIVSTLLLLASWPSARGQTNAPAWLQRPLSLAESLDIALQQNSALLKAKADLEAAYGVILQTRAIAVPKLRAGGSYRRVEPQGVETFPSVPGGIVSPFPDVTGDESWSAEIRLVQSIYEGGRITSAFRSARLTKEQAILEYQTTLADTLLSVRTAYLDVLLAEQQITVQEASLDLLHRELEDQKRRFDAGTVPRFNVLRAEVEVANARPRLIRARNSYRIAKNNLVNLLGYRLPPEVWQDIPLQLSGRMEVVPYDTALPAAIARALDQRTELAALRKAVGLARERIVAAQALRKPSVQLFAGYGSRNSVFTDDLAWDVSGWFGGAQLTWDIFDGLSTKGRIDQAKALHRRAQADLDDHTRQIELQVRTAYSNWLEARELLESQAKVQEQAEEALRLATVRSEAGTGTQLDVLNAQTALTLARTTQIEALHDYAVARAQLGRAVGDDLAVHQAE